MRSRAAAGLRSRTASNTATCLSSAKGVAKSGSELTTIEARSASSMQAPSPESKRIAAGREEQAVEGDVRLRGLFGARAVAAHHVEQRRLELGEHGRRGVLRRERRRLRFHHPAHSDEFAQEDRLGHDPLPPAQEVDVEEIPVERFADKRAELRARAHQALAAKHLQRLAQAGAADAEFRKQRGFVRQRLAGRVFAARGCAGPAPARPWPCRARPAPFTMRVDFPQIPEFGRRYRAITRARSIADDREPSGRADRRAWGGARRLLHGSSRVRPDATSGGRCRLFPACTRRDRCKIGSSTVLPSISSISRRARGSPSRTDAGRPGRGCGRPSARPSAAAACRRR